MHDTHVRTTGRPALECNTRSPSVAASGRSCAQPRSLSCAPLAAPARRRLHCCPQGPSRHVGNDQDGHDQESGTSATTHNSPNWTPPPSGTHTHVRRRVFGQVPSSCCSPPPPVKAGRAPSRALIRRAQRDRRVPRQLVGAQPRHKDTARRRSPGQREHNEACALPSYSLPYKCCSGNRPAGSWAVLLASRLHTPEARDHHTRATRPASTARVSPAQPWVQAPNTSALARHGDSLCQRRRQSSCHSFHHHDTDSHCQFRPRHNPQLDAATHTHTFAVASSDRYPAAVVRLLPP